MSSIFSQPLPSIKSRVPVKTFSLFFCELIKFFNEQTNSVTELQQMLSDCGKQIGVRFLELISITERSRRLSDPEDIIQKVVCKSLFGFLFDRNLAKISLERARQKNDYMIKLKEAVLSQYISQQSYGRFNPEFFLAGIIEGVLQSCGLNVQVSAYYQDRNDLETTATAFYIKLEDS
ncbi:hypothetical protein PCE1_001983 [Barthelona sp. PCE]